MQRHVAFLRGINLGGRRLSMDRLRAAFEELGFSNVATFIASGNVIFDAAGDAGRELEARIEAHLARVLGYDVDTFLRPLDELHAIARGEGLPGADDPDWNVHVMFLRDAPGRDIATNLKRLETEGDRFVVRGREVFWQRRGKLSESTIETADLARALRGATSTMRNMNTVRRIVSRFSR